MPDATIPAGARPLVVLKPEEAARRVGTDVPGLVAMLRRANIPWQETRPGARPGARGRYGWGLTEAQVERVIRAQERAFVPGPEAPALAAPAPGETPDGVSRLKPPRRRRKD